MKKTVALIALLTSSTALGACENAAMLERPDIPNGREATFEEMLVSQDAVKAYVKSGEAYLNCFMPEPFVYNYVVQRLERTAKAYNRQRERFLQQREAVAVN